jgi:tRNA uridine 5-carboxymethylaminomethyl modification enzyme
VPTLAEWLKRPEIEWEQLCELHPELAGLGIPARSVQEIVTEIKYEGYVARQQLIIDKQERGASIKIPEHFRFEGIVQLRHEAREKLIKVRPRDLAQAGRISGITPADLTVLMLYLDDPKRFREN